MVSNVIYRCWYGDDWYYKLIVAKQSDEYDIHFNEQVKKKLVDW